MTQAVTQQEQRNLGNASAKPAAQEVRLPYRRPTLTDLGPVAAVTLGGTFGPGETGGGVLDREFGGPGGGVP